MQIFLGVHETIIKINSKNIKIDYIQHFINSHFSEREISKNILYIPASKSESSHRIFLLKWLYTLYSKKTQIIMPQLKESLVARHTKPIKIVFPQELIHTISWSVLDDSTLKITLQPANLQIALTIKHFFRVKINIFTSHFTMKLHNQEQKDLLKDFIYTPDIIDVPHVHIFDKQSIQNFIQMTQESKYLSYLEKAKLLLGSKPTDDEKRLKKRYKELAKEYHPDKAVNQSLEYIDLQTKKFQTILHAYTIVAEHMEQEKARS